MSAVVVADPRKTWAPGAMSWMISATPTPWFWPAANTLQTEPSSRQKVPDSFGTSPVASALFHAVVPKESMMPTCTPLPITPAACQLSASVLATSSPRKSPLPGSPFRAIGELTTSGTRTKSTAGSASRASSSSKGTSPSTSTPGTLPVTVPPWLTTRARAAAAVVWWSTSTWTRSPETDASASVVPRSSRSLTTSRNVSSASATSAFGRSGTGPGTWVTSGGSADGTDLASGGAGRHGRQDSSDQDRGHEDRDGPPPGGVCVCHDAAFPSRR